MPTSRQATDIAVTHESSVSVMEVNVSAIVPWCCFVRSCWIGIPFVLYPTRSVSRSDLQHKENMPNLQRKCTSISVERLGVLFQSLVDLQYQIPHLVDWYEPLEVHVFRVFEVARCSPLCKDGADHDEDRPTASPTLDLKVLDRVCKGTL